MGTACRTGRALPAISCQTCAARHVSLGILTSIQTCTISAEQSCRAIRLYEILPDKKASFSREERHTDGLVT